MDERMVDLETRATFLEDTVLQLNDTVVRQQKDLELLRTAVARLDEQVRRLNAEKGAEGEEGPPPHY